MAAPTTAWNENSSRRRHVVAAVRVTGCAVGGLRKREAYFEVALILLGHGKLAKIFFDLYQFGSIEASAALVKARHCN